MISREDIADLRKEFDEVYVKKGSCSEFQRIQNDKFANDDKRIEMLMHDMASIKKALWLIASTTTGVLITGLINLLMK